MNNQIATDEKVQIVESKQLVETPSENIKHFEVKSTTVKAVFWNAKQSAEYVKKYSAFKFNPNWYDKVGFADFSIHGNEIHAISTYHTASTMISMFENGLRNL